MEGGGFIIEPGDASEPKQASTQPSSWQSDLISPTPLSEDPSSRGCSRCSSISFSSEFQKAFGVLLCNQCRRNEKLISKSSAKQTYHVTDGDLKKLGSLRKPNPQKKNWQPMQLYLESQVQNIAYNKHGSKEGVEKYGRELLDQKLQARLKKRELEKDRDEKHAQRLLRMKKEIQKNASVTKIAAIDEDDTEEI